LNDAVYRFVQEGLNNSSQHAGGRGQKVKADVAARVLRVAVSDAGQGFDIEKVQSLPLHLGLSGMRNRILAIGGEFEIVTFPGAGTTLVATIPLSRFMKRKAKDRKLVPA
jgi:signal transduction histidine kinase